MLYVVLEKLFAADRAGRLGFSADCIVVSLRMLEDLTDFQLHTDGVMSRALVTPMALLLRIHMDTTGGPAGIV